MRVLLLLALASCTYEEKQFSDPFGCLGAPPPTTAEPVVTIAGHTFDPFAAGPDMQPLVLSGVAVELQSQDMLRLDGPETSAADGAFSFSFTTGGAVFDDLYLNATAAGRVNTFLRPPRPIAGDIDLRFTVPSLEQRSILATMAFGMPTFPADTGAILGRILNCNGEPLLGATLSATRGRVYYFDQVFPDPMAQATDTLGVVMLAELPAGEVTLTPSFDGMTFRPITLTSVIDAFVQHDFTP